MFVKNEMSANCRHCSSWSLLAKLVYSVAFRSTVCLLTHTHTHTHTHARTHARTHTQQLSTVAATVSKHSLIFSLSACRDVLHPGVQVTENKNKINHLNLILQCNCMHRVSKFHENSLTTSIMSNYLRSYSVGKYDRNLWQTLIRTNGESRWQGKST